MTFSTVIPACLLGLAISVGVMTTVIWLSGRFGLARLARDLHHTHRNAVPRLGGIGLAAAYVGVKLYSMIVHPLAGVQAREEFITIFGALGMFGIGLSDDFKPLGARRKLLAQLAVALGVYYLGIGIEEFRLPFAGITIHLNGLGWLATVIWLVGMTNLVNLIDGVDGLAGGICLMVMVLLAYVGQQAGNVQLSAAGMAGALVGFLCFNFPPARIYMGDGGAYFLGALIGLQSIKSSQKGTVVAALVAPLFVLALPIVDTLLAILRRGLQGLPIFRPDRRHIHHRLLSTGASRRKVVLGIYAFTAVFLVLGFAAFWSQGYWLPALAGVAVLVLLLTAGRMSFSREWFAVGRVVGNSLEMRREIQYAMSLSHWLALEGSRAPSVDSLWNDLVFASRKLGLCYVRLQLTDGERVWDQRISTVQEHRSYTHRVQAGNLGVVEFKSALCPRANPAGACSALNQGRFRGACPCVADETVFEIVTELLAEGWFKAARRWPKPDDQPLSFNAIAPEMRTERFRGTRRRLLPSVNWNRA